MRTKVVNIRHEPYDVYIGRAGKGLDGYFGNPYRIEDVGSREKAIELYKEYFAARVSTDEEFKQRVLALKGFKLACWCQPKACHGDVIVEWLEGPTTESKQMRLL